MAVITHQPIGVCLVVCNFRRCRFGQPITQPQAEIETVWNVHAASCCCSANSGQISRQSCGLKMSPLRYSGIVTTHTDRKEDTMKTAVDFFSENLTQLSPEQHPVEYATQAGLLDLANRLVFLTRFPDGVPGLAHRLEVLQEHVSGLQASLSNLKEQVEFLAQQFPQAPPQSGSGRPDNREADL